MAQEKFGERVRAVMLAAGMATPEQLGEAIGVSRRTAEKWLAQREPKMSSAHMFKLAVRLSVRVTWLMTGEGPSGWRLHARPEDFERAVGILEAMNKQQCAAWLKAGEQILGRG